MCFLAGFDRLTYLTVLYCMAALWKSVDSMEDSRLALLQLLARMPKIAQAHGAPQQPAGTASSSSSALRND